MSSQSPKLLKDIFEKAPAVWQPRNDHLLSHVIRMQIANAMRNFMPTFLWRYRGDKSSVNNVYREATKRVYDPPVVALLHIINSAPNKILTKAMVEDEISHEIKVDLGEAIRLGEIYDTYDEELGYHFYVPGASDLFQWNKGIYEISDSVAEQYYKLVNRHVVWAGKAKLYKSSSVDPVTPLPQEAKLEEPVWLR